MTSIVASQLYSRFCMLKQAPFVVSPLLIAARPQRPEETVARFLVLEVTESHAKPGLRRKRLECMSKTFSRTSNPRHPTK